MNSKLLLWGFFATMVGSSLAGIGVFLSIEPYFGSIYNLGLALALKTATGVLLSLVSSKINSRFGIKAAIVWSQLFGLASTSILWLGFANNTFWLAAAGIIMSSVPSTFLQINMTASLKLVFQDEKEFRKASNWREMIAAGALLAAAIIVPFVLLKFSIFHLLAFDAFTFLVGLLIFLGIRLSSGEKKTSKTQKLAWAPAATAPGFTYLIGCLGALLLMALLPVAGSSTSFGLTDQLPQLLRESFWGIEALTGILGGTLYAFVIRFPILARLRHLAVFNGVCLAALLLAPVETSWMLTFAMIIMTAGLMRLTTFSLRDDLMMAARRQEDQIQEFASFSHLIRQLVGVGSPLILVFVFDTFSITAAILGLVAWQIVFGAAYLVLRQRVTQTTE